MKRFLGVTLSALFVPAIGAAAVHGRYRIALRDGREVVAADLPVQRGSVVTFHEASSGALTGLPSEQVLIVSDQADSARVARRPFAADVDEIAAGAGGERTVMETLARPMQPGELVDIGPTGEGSAQLDANANAAPAAGGSVAAPLVGAYAGGGGGGYPPTPRVPIAAPPGSTLSALSGEPPTVGPDGFPIMSGNPPTIGPNGTPISSSDQAVIGANGTPVLAATGSPGATAALIGANGTPMLAPAGSPGAGAVVIGANGTPVLAPAGSPGAAAVVIGSNGTPVLAPAGSPGAAPPNIASNGTPAAPAPGAGHH